VSDPLHTPASDAVDTIQRALSKNYDNANAISAAARSGQASQGWKKLGFLKQKLGF